MPTPALGAFTRSWILPRAKNCSPALNFYTSVRTGAALSNPHPTIKNHQPQKWLVIFWQRMRDSNPRKRSQSPVCYRYTNPLCGRHGYYYTQSDANVKNFFPVFTEIFLADSTSMPLVRKPIHAGFILPRGTAFRG